MDPALGSCAVGIAGTSLPEKKNLKRVLTLAML